MPVTLADESSYACFAYAQPAETDLLTIINKAVNSLSGEEKSSLLNQNLVSPGESQLNLEELIYADPVAFVVVLGVVLIMIAGAILLVTRSRMKAAVIQSNLERAEAESRQRASFCPA